MPCTALATTWSLLGPTSNHTGTATMSLNTTPLSKLPAIKPGCFLVLHGVQGAGKSTLARRIATGRGKFSTIHIGHLEDANLMAEALASFPSTLIVEDEGMRRRDFAQLKALVTSTHLHLRPAFALHATKLPVPPVIVCTNDASPYSDSRRAQLFLVHND